MSLTYKSPSPPVRGLFHLTRFQQKLRATSHTQVVEALSCVVTTSCIPNWLHTSSGRV